MSREALGHLLRDLLVRHEMVVSFKGYTREWNGPGASTMDEDVKELYRRIAETITAGATENAARECEAAATFDSAIGLAIVTSKGADYLAGYRAGCKESATRIRTRAKFTNSQEIKTTRDLVRAELDEDEVANAEVETGAARCVCGHLRDEHEIGGQGRSWNRCRSSVLHHSLNGVGDTMLVRYDCRCDHFEPTEPMKKT